MFYNYNKFIRYIDKNIACAMISEGSSLVSTLANVLDGGHTARKNARAIASYQADLNQQAVDKQNAWNLEQWNRQNEYDSPLAQRQRLEAAGINPAGFDGGSFSATGNQQITSANQIAPDVAAAAQAGNAIYNSQLQAQALVAQTAKTIAETRKIGADAKGQELVNEYLPKMQQGQIDLLGAEFNVKNTEVNMNKELAVKYHNDAEVAEQSVKSLQQSIQESIERMANISQDTINKRQLYSQNEQMFPHLVQQIDSIVAKNMADSKLTLIDASMRQQLIEMEIEHLRSQASLNSAQERMEDAKTFAQRVYNRFAPQLVRESLQNQVFTNSSLMMQNEKFRIGLNDYKDIHTFDKGVHVVSEAFSVLNMAEDAILRPVHEGEKFIGAFSGSGLGSGSSSSDFRLGQ